MNHYKTSSGERIPKSTIDKRIREAKKEKIQQQLDEYGYNFCEKCGISSGVRLDCAHVESVDICQKNGRCEKAYDVSNIKILCRKHHQEYDGLDLKFKINSDDRS